MKLLLLNFAFLLSINAYWQNKANNYTLSTYVGTIQYYGDLNETKSNIDIRTYFQTKDPLFGLCIGKK